ncbi:acyl-CoA dehydrogenase, partial [Actinospica acidiphila]
RYTVALAAAACLGVHRTAPSGDFLARPQWLAAALTRLSAVERPSGAQLPPEIEDALMEELVDRYDRRVSFGLSARPYA